MSSTPFALDVEFLLKPISIDHPAGMDLRTDAIEHDCYDQIRRERSAARSVERRLDVEPDHDRVGLQKNWNSVFELSQKLLAEDSKDLEIAAYLLEALIRVHGFSGLRDGFTIVRRIVEEYWPDIYPKTADNQHPELSHLAGLNGGEVIGSLIGPILTQPLTGGGVANEFICTEFMQARQLETLSPEDRERQLESVQQVTMDEFRRAVAETPTGFYVRLQQDVDECLEEFQQLRSTLIEVCGDQAPPTTNILEALETSAEILTYIAGPADHQNAEEMIDDAKDSDASRTSSTGNAMSETIRTREEALLALEEVAAFYRRSEPHSPMSSAASQLACWGKMTLPELVDILIPDEQARTFFRMRTGMDETMR
ncbi:MAG: type VI secretion system protein TssA [Pirellulaceae bacterium]|nr:type VI secretion system protein TssA [Pirellulaceae bacterium]